MFAKKSRKTAPACDLWMKSRTVDNLRPGAIARGDRAACYLKMAPMPHSHRDSGGTPRLVVGCFFRRWVVDRASESWDCSVARFRGVRIGLPSPSLVHRRYAGAVGGVMSGALPHFGSPGGRISSSAPAVRLNGRTPRRT